MTPPRIDLMGCPIDAITLEQALDHVEDFIAAGGTHIHVSVNAYKVVQMSRDPQVSRLVRRCDLATADGAGVVLASRFLGTPIPQRVPGIDLFLSLVARAADRGWKPYFFGAKKDVVDEVVARLRGRYPALQIAGHRDGYFSSDEEQAVAEVIRDSQADLLFVAISSPKKEHFLERWSATMQVPFMMGVGGSFDVVAGRVDRAPRFLRDRHLEWAWRTAKEPRRIWRRALVDHGKFVIRVIQARFLGYRLPTF